MKSDTRADTVIAIKQLVVDIQAQAGSTFCSKQKHPQREMSTAPIRREKTSAILINTSLLNSFKVVTNVP